VAPNSADLEPIDHAVRLETAQRVCHSKKFDAIDRAGVGALLITVSLNEDVACNVSWQTRSEDVSLHVLTVELLLLQQCRN